MELPDDVNLLSEGYLIFIPASFLSLDLISLVRWSSTAAPRQLSAPFPSIESSPENLHLFHRPDRFDAPSRHIEYIEIAPWICTEALGQLPLLHNMSFRFLWILQPRL